MKQTIQTLLLLLPLLFGAAGAQAIPLSDLFNGGSITAGDKLFDRWELLFYDSSEVDRSFNADNIDVEALNDGGLDPGPGLRFSVTQNELSVTGDGIYAFVDLMFGFRVSVLDPQYLVKDNTLAFSPGGAILSWQVDDSNDLGVYVRETVGTASGLDDLGAKDIEFSHLDEELLSKLTDSVGFLPRGEIWVTKNILVWAVDETDTATLFGFDQRFSQTVIPEPGTVTLMLLGVAGLVAARKKKWF